MSKKTGSGSWREAWAMADGKQQQPNQTQQGPAAAQDQVAGPSVSASPLQARQLRITRARRYNKEHAGEAAEFKRLTGIDPMEISAIQKWQA
ncbi:MAG TPA: hypothetical protein VHW01_09845, partial [Polyangiaceae bacterium]|nr:hypothetical protein [Polyangiaceae bacterium]